MMTTQNDLPPRALGESMLELRSVSKSFPGVRAMQDVSITVRHNEVVGLIGENGAGKSTLLSILAGTQQADTGSVYLRGVELHLRNLSDANRMGIGLVFQEQSLIPNLTVAENLLLGGEQDAVRGGVFRWKTMRRNAARILKTLDIAVDPAAITETLTFAQRQMVELAKALSLEHRVGVSPLILLDEPTSVLEGPDIERLFDQIEVLREHGSCIFVSHRLDEVLRASDRVYVMRDGNVVAELDNVGLEHEDLYSLMVGHASTDSTTARVGPSALENARTRLTVRDLRVGESVRGVDLEVRAGEILGIAGVIGSGREDLCRALFGLTRIDAGTVTLDGVALRLSGTSQAVKHGIGYVPAERRSEGVGSDLSVADNFFLGNFRILRRGPFIDRRSWSRSLGEWMSRLRVKAPSAEVAIGILSGGNQQKVVLARILNSKNLKLLILDHPTRGLDVGAKDDVAAVIDEARNRGIGVLLISDTLEETIALSDNIIVLRDGQISGWFAAPKDNKPSAAKVVECMV